MAALHRARVGQLSGAPPTTTPPVPPRWRTDRPWRGLAVLLGVPLLLWGIVALLRVAPYWAGLTMTDADAITLAQTEGWPLVDAVHAYHRDHGRWPVTLDDAVSAEDLPIGWAFLELRDGPTLFRRIGREAGDEWVQYHFDAGSWYRHGEQSKVLNVPQPATQPAAPPP